MLQPKKATDYNYDDNNGDSGSGSRNTWAAMGIPGNWEAGGTHLGKGLAFYTLTLSSPQTLA